MKRFARFAPALLCLALGGCSDLATEVVCPEQARPAVVLNVIDPVSSLSVSRLATGTWRNGTLTGPLVHVPNEVEGKTMLAAYGPPGVYEVRVALPGYRDWMGTNIVVQPGVCGPEPAGLTVQHVAIE